MIKYPNLGGGKGRNNPGLQMGNQMMYVELVASPPTQNQ
jgi:hypothetical protein